VTCRIQGTQGFVTVVAGWHNWSSASMLYSEFKPRNGVSVFADGFPARAEGAGWSIYRGRATNARRRPRERHISNVFFLWKNESVCRLL